MVAQEDQGKLGKAERGKNGDVQSAKRKDERNLQGRKRSKACEDSKTQETRGMRF